MIRLPEEHHQAGMDYLERAEYIAEKSGSPDRYQRATMYATLAAAHFAAVSAVYQVTDGVTLAQIAEDRQARTDPGTS